MCGWYPSLTQRSVRIIFAAPILCWLSVGCEEPLRLAAKPESVKLVEFSRSERESYDWNLQGSGFESLKPSFFTFFDEAEPDVRAWVSKEPWSIQPVECIKPDGMDPEAFRLFQLAADTPRSLEKQCEITRQAIVGDGAFALSRDGELLATSNGKQIQTWNPRNGELLKSIPSPLPKIQLIEFASSEKRLFVTGETRVCCIDYESGTTAAESDRLPEPIVQWQVGITQSTVVAKCGSGKVLLMNSSLDEMIEVPNVKAVSNVTINPKADRIAFWDARDPIEFYVDGLKPVNREVVDKLTATGNNRLVASGYLCTRWSRDMQIFEWQHTEFGKKSDNRYWRLRDFAWEPIEFWGVSRGEKSDSLLVHAIRHQNHSKSEHVLVDVALNWQDSSYAVVIPGEPQAVRVSLDGQTVAVVDSHQLQIFRRLRWQRVNFHTVASGIANTYLYDDVHQLDYLEDLILKNEVWWRYGLSAQDAFAELVEELGRTWARMELTKDPDEKLATQLKKLDAWLKEGGNVARLASAMRRSIVGWEARGSGTASTVSNQGWKGFQDQINLLAEDLKPCWDMDKPPLSAIEQLITYYQVTGKNYEDAEKWLCKSAQLYPYSWRPHSNLMAWLLPRWGGSVGEPHAYALRFSQMYDHGYGEYLYARMTLKLQGYFGGNSDYLERETGMRALRIRNGLLYSLQLPGVDHQFLELTTALVATSLNDKELKLVLDRYYQTFPWVPTGGYNQFFENAMRSYAAQLKK